MGKIEQTFPPKTPAPLASAKQCISPTALKVSVFAAGLLILGSGLACYLLHVNTMASCVIGGTGIALIIGTALRHVRDRCKMSPIEKVTIKQLKGVPTDRIKIFARQLEVTEGPVIPRKPGQDLLKLPLVRFYRLPIKEINTVISEIPEEGFALFTVEQIPQLDLSKISEEQIGKLLRMKIYPNYDRGHIQERIEALNPTQLQDLLDKFSDPYLVCSLALIPQKHLQQLDLSRVSAEKLLGLFGSNSKETEERLAALSPAQVQTILNKLPPYYLHLIPKDHLGKLDLSVLSAENLTHLIGSKQ